MKSLDNQGRGPVWGRRCEDGWGTGPIKIWVYPNPPPRVLPDRQRKEKEVGDMRPRERFRDSFPLRNRRRKVASVVVKYWRHRCYKCERLGHIRSMCPGVPSSGEEGAGLREDISRSSSSTTAEDSSSHGSGQKNWRRRGRPPNGGKTLSGVEKPHSGIP